MICPECGSGVQSLSKMDERNRFMCFACRRVWHIANVIAEAQAGRVPTDMPMFERQTSQVLLHEIYQFFAAGNPVAPDAMFDDERTYKQAVAEWLASAGIGGKGGGS